MAPSRKASSLALVAALSTSTVLATTSDPKTDCAESLIPGTQTDTNSYQSYPDALLTCRHGKNFLTSFGKNTKTPDWSAYHITTDESTHEHGGRSKFKQDPDIPSDSQAPVHSHCWGNKWNRGHLCPSNIMSYDKVKNGHWSDTYYITNTAMQYGPFNQGTWEHVEKHTLNWIQAHKDVGGIYIVTGTLFEDRNNLKESTRCHLSTGSVINPGEDSNAENESTDDIMAVPDFYYKMMCDPKNKKSIVYMGRNVADTKKIGITEHSVDEIQGKLGIKLLPDAKCDIKNFDSDYWFEPTSYEGMRIVRGKNDKIDDSKVPVMQAQQEPEQEPQTEVLFI